MTSEDVRNAIEVRLQDNWATTPIAWDNVSYKPVRGTPFIRCQMEEVFSEIKGLSCTSVNGLLTIQVFTPAKEGTENNIQNADALVALFQGFSVDTLVMLSGRIERAGSEDNWHQRNVQIDYKFDKYF